MIDKHTVTLKTKLYIGVLIAVISSLIASGGYLFYQQQADALRRVRYHELKAIADLKESQIENWIQERKADAELITQSPLFIDGISRWIQDNGNMRLKERITEGLKPVQKELGYKDIFLAKTNGDLLLSANGNFPEFESFIKQKIKEASVKNEIVFTDFYLGQKDNKIYYDIITPVIYNESKPIAVLVFRRDPNDFLFPLIQNWPTPSKSAETAILRVENDSVIFLNELRHLKNTALKFKIPLTQTEVPAVQAALGRTGLFEGIDYRGVAVLSDIRIIPGSNWVMFSKVDKSEIYADLNLTAGIIAGFTILLIIICGIGFAFIYNSRQKTIYKELYGKERELWGQQEKFKVTMDSLGEGIITLDINGKVQYLNKLAEELTGWNMREARGRELHDIYPVKNEESGQRENNILNKIYKHGIVKELANHTLLISKSGKEIPVMDTGAPVHDNDGTVIGIVIAFQDETEKRKQQKLIKESEIRLRSTMDNLIEGCQILSYQYTYLYLNSAAIESSHKTQEELIGKTMMECYPGIEKTEMFSKLKQCIEERISHNIENEFIYPDGEKRVFNLRFEPVPEGVFILSEDITEHKLAEKAHRQLLAIIEATPDFIGMADLNGSPNYINTAGRNMFGIGMDDDLSKFNIADFHPDWAKRIVLNEGLPAATKNGSWYGETAILHRNGSVKPVSQIIIAHKSSDGNVEYLSTLCRDISERKKYENEIIEKSKLLESFFENTLTLNAIMDKDFNFIRVNQAYANADEHDVAFFIGKNYFDLYPTDTMDIFEEVVRTKITYQAIERPFTYINNPERGVSYWDWSLTPLLDTDGEVELLILNLLNVTNRVKTNKELLENEIFLSALFNSVNDAIFTVSMPDRKIRTVNKAVSDLFGYESVEIIGKPTRLLYTSEEAYQEYGNILTSTIKENKPYAGAELKLKKKDGTEIFCDVQTTLLIREGEKDLVISILHDITDRKRILDELIESKEKAEESDKLKTAFLANMSHEIRTPMNGILGFTELLLEPDLSSEEKEEFIKIVHLSGQRMLNTVNNIVEISKIEAGLVQLNLTRTDVNGRMEELIRFFQPEAERKGIKLHLEMLLPPMDKNMITDQSKLDSILTNLIKNAIKYTKEGEIRVGCQAMANQLEFYVKDTGIGIPKERQQAVFERFIQADIFDKEARQGSGLGLAISKAYVEMLGGEIRVESNPDAIPGGQGSSFFFTLPTNGQGQEIAGEIKIRKGNKSISPIKGLKIVIAEDDENSAIYLQTILKSDAGKIILTQKGHEAVEACRNDPDIDLVLMDIQMPGMNGYEATRRIREFNKKVIIIAQTAYGLSGDREKTIESGCNDYLSKPVNKNELLALIQKYLGK